MKTKYIADGTILNPFTHPIIHLKNLNMKKIIFSLFLVSSVILFSCSKSGLNSTTSPTQAAIQAAATQVQAVAIAKSATTQGDSIYVIQTCGQHDRRTQIDFSALPASAINYLTANYSGYTSVKAFSIIDSSGTITGYIAVINYNGNPVGIKFDASGNFVKVLEQREGRDLLGEGWHHGGCFDLRDGEGRDTLALSSLLSSIQSYLATNYSGDTLLKAFVKRDGDYVVISRNNGLYATIFSSTGIFINRVTLPSRQGNITPLDAGNLPSAITSYLSATYPGYVFDKAFSFTRNNVLQGYAVVIDSNNTKYCLLFDASGNFVSVKVIH
jgi:hypothetical protein